MKQVNISDCPYKILVPEHYRDDGSCRCTDINHSEMVMWGYKWSLRDEMWIDPHEGEN